MKILLILTFFLKFILSYIYRYIEFIILYICFSFIESWVELNPVPDRITPLPFSSGGEEYLRLLREAQRDSLPSSARHSLASSRRGTPRDRYLLLFNLLSPTLLRNSISCFPILILLCLRNIAQN